MTKTFIALNSIIAFHLVGLLTIEPQAIPAAVQALLDNNSVLRNLFRETMSELMTREPIDILICLTKEDAVIAHFFLDGDTVQVAIADGDGYIDIDGLPLDLDRRKRSKIFEVFMGDSAPVELVKKIKKEGPIPFRGIVGLLTSESEKRKEQLAAEGIVLRDFSFLTMEELGFVAKKAYP